MGALVDGLEDAIRAHCSAAMRAHYEGDLVALDTRSLAQDYVTWKARFPRARARALLESDVLGVSRYRERYEAGLAAITRDIEAGVDLTPYLSSLVRSAHGRDRLPAAWGAIWRVPDQNWYPLGTQPSETPPTR
jgi:hypothetical protein